MDAIAGGYLGADQPQLSDLDKCTRCGLCEQACPTYRLLQFEPDSPRGRIFLMKEVALGRAAVDANLAEHLYRCLGCRACETACPSGVPFGRLLEYGRHQVELHGELTPKRRRWRSFRSITFDRILPRQRLFGTLMLPARMLQAMPPVLAFAQSLPLPRRLAQLVRMIPRRLRASGAVPVRPIAVAEQPQIASTTSAGGTRVIPAQGQRRARVGLFSGCVMRSLFGHVHAATARVLARNGCDVVIVPGQWCCGALNVHAGERRFAAQMARANIAAFADADLDAIVVNSAGCGAVMKEYAELLDGDGAAAQFADKVKDATEWLSVLGLRPGLRPLHLKVTYQDACHLAHGQRVRKEPRALLAAIPGLTFVEMHGADRCCGAAGVYSLTQPDLAGKILAQKLEDVARTKARVVATTNPGCAMQLQAGLLTLGLDVEVCHLMELLDYSYGGGPEYGTIS